MKILFVSFCAPRPEDQTFGVFVDRMAQGLCRLGHSVDILVPVRVFPTEHLVKTVLKPSAWHRVPAAWGAWRAKWRNATGCVRTNGIRYIYRRFSTLPATSRGGMNSVSFVRMSQRFLGGLARENGYDHVMGHFLETVPLVEHLGAEANCSRSVYVHEDVEDLLRTPFGKTAVASLRGDTLLLANSARTRTQLSSFVGGRRAEVVHLGVEWCDDRSRRSVRAEGPVKLVCVSRYVPRKNQDLLLRLLLKRRAEGRPGVTLTLVGDRSPFRDHLQAMVAGERLQDAVTFVDAADHGVIMRELSAADIFVFPSRFESFGLVLVEALGMGVPSLSAPNVGAYQELKHLGHEVPTFDETSVESLDRAVSAIIDNYPASVARAQELQRFVRQTFAWDNTAATVASLIEKERRW